MNLWYLETFNQPVAFYAYTSRVMSPILSVEAHCYCSTGNTEGLSEDEIEICELIEKHLTRADKLRRSNGHCSTRFDNKTVVEMSNGHKTLFFGCYDGNYWVGLEVNSDFDCCCINLSDLSAKDWYNLNK